MIVVNEEELLIRMLQMPRNILEAIADKRTRINAIEPIADKITTIVNGKEIEVDITKGWPGIIYFTRDLLSHDPLYIVQVPDTVVKAHTSLAFEELETFPFVKLENAKIYKNVADCIHKKRPISKSAIQNADMYPDGVIVDNSHIILLAAIMPYLPGQVNLNAVFINKDIAMAFLNSVKYKWENII